MFRHLAMGRRNWHAAGSHNGALNLAFLYSLYESCKLNDLNFGEYIEDILTRMMNGKTDYTSLIPCNYKPLVAKPEDVLHRQSCAKYTKFEIKHNFLKPILSDYADSQQGRSYGDLLWTKT